MNRHPNNPNKGLDVRRYLLMVGVALIVLLVGIVIVVRPFGKKVAKDVDRPKPTAAASPQ